MWLCVIAIYTPGRGAPDHTTFNFCRQEIEVVFCEWAYDLYILQKYFCVLVCVQTSDWDQYYSTCRVETGIIRWVVLWDTACNFNDIILNQSLFNRLITSATTLTLYLVFIILRSMVLFIKVCLTSFITGGQEESLTLGNEPLGLK